MRPKLIDAIAAFRDVSQTRKRLFEEKAVMEARLKEIETELDGMDDLYTKARQALLQEAADKD